MSASRPRVLYLVRHGEHRSERDEGPDGGRLTEVGIRQCELLAERLATVPFTAIYHSDWTRAVQTAEILAAHHPGVPMQRCQALRECIPAVPAPQRLSPEQAGWFRRLPASLVSEGAGQATRALEMFAGPSRRGARELLVTHGNLVNWFVSQALDAPPWAWTRMLDYNCGLTVILYLSDRTKVVTYNDVGHLPPELRGTSYPPEARI